MAKFGISQKVTSIQSEIVLRGKGGGPFGSDHVK